jgi:AraC-like DNA-binding protein
VYFLSGAEKIAFINRMNVDRPLDFAMIDGLKPLHGLIYTILTILMIARHNKRIRDVFSNIDRINLVWLRSLTVGIAFIWAIVVASAASHVLTVRSTGSDAAIYFCISLLIYAIGYMGLNQPEIFTQPTNDIQPETAEDATGEPKYARSGLTDTAADEILAKLRKLMESERPYLNGDLTLTKLAESISVSPHNLSEAMNTRLNQSFYDFVNSYRVNEVKRRLQAGDAATYSILSLAYDSGFTSKTSFNTIFKKHSGMTPSQFIESHTSAPHDSRASAEPQAEKK